MSASNRSDDSGRLSHDIGLFQGHQQRPAATWKFRFLLRSLKTNDPRAYQEVSARYGGRIRAFAAAQGVEAPDVIVNETLLAIFQQANTFAGTESHFTSAIFAIARNKIIDDLRRVGRRPSQKPLHDDVDGIAATDTADEYISHAVTLSILDNLDPTQRDIVIMRTLLGMSFREIGQALDKQEATVRVAHHRALLRLRNLLATSNKLPDR